MKPHPYILVRAFLLMVTLFAAGYINPSRYGKSGNPGVLCQWDFFEDTIKTQLYSMSCLPPSHPMDSSTVTTRI